MRGQLIAVTTFALLAGCTGVDVDDTTSAVTNGVVTRERRYFHDKIGRIRDVAVSPDGFIYLLTDGTEASLYRLEPIEDLVAKAKPF